MPAPKSIICWSCKESIELPERVTRTDTCPKCDQPLKCCYNCRFYDRDAYHQCTEPQAEWVRYKEKANFCEFFTPKGPVTAAPQPAPAQPPVRSQAQSRPQSQNRGRGRNGNGNGNESKPEQRDKLKAAWDSLFKE